jgi:iron complex transport system ATP-binding protein
VNLDFPGVSLSQTDQVLLLRSRRPLRALASTVVGGGFSEVACFLNRHVSKSYNQADPAGDLRAFARDYGLNESFIGLMTAAYLDQARTVTLRDGSLCVAVVTTAGLSNATAAGLSAPAPPAPGTINLIVLIDADLTRAAMVNVVITATEAKTHVLLQQNIITPEGQPATGTSTDAIVVACSGRGEALAYAGPATRVGWLVGRGVRQTLSEIIKES